MKKRSIAGLSASGILLSAGLLGTMVSNAEAADLTESITSITTNSTTAAIGDTIKLDANWSVPDNSQPGDTFTLALPSTLSPLTKTFSLTNDKGDVVATANVVNGNVVVTLSDYVSSHPLNISGTLHFSAQVNHTATAGEPIQINWGGKSAVVNVREYGTTGAPKTATKYGWASSSAYGNVGWAIDVPGKISNAVVTDTPNDDVKLNCSSIHVQVGSISDGKYPSSFTNMTPKPSIQCSPTSLTISLGDLPADQLAHITVYSSTSSDVSKVTNNYTVKGNDVSQGGSATAPVYDASGTGDGNTKPTPTPTDTPTSTPTPSPSDTPTPTPSDTPTTPTPTPSDTSTPTPSDTPSDTPTPSPSDTPTPTPSDTPSNNETPVPSKSPSESPATSTSTPSSTVSKGATVNMPKNSTPTSSDKTATAPSDGASQIAETGDTHFAQITSVIVVALIAIVSAGSIILRNRKGVVNKDM